MKVLFVMYTFPDLEKGFNMYTTLVEQFVANGHEVTVLAPTQGTTQLSLEKNIEIIRVRSLQNTNVSKIMKGLSTLLLPYQFLKALKKFYPHRSYDLVISPTPPITFAHLIKRIKKKHNTKFYLMLRDIFPQNAVDLAYMKKGGPSHLYFRKVEKKYYQLADYIGCMSQGNIDYIRQHNPEVGQTKLHILRNFQKQYTSTDFNQQELQKLKEKYGLTNSFVVVFGGNMGKPQQLENVLELARRCIEYPEVKFLLLGNGFEMDRLIRQIKAQAIMNIIIQKSLPKDGYQHLLSVCDLGLISLHRDFTIPNIPSKILDYMNIGLPILASIDKATDFDRILLDSKSGLYSFAGDHDAFKANFDEIYNNQILRKQMGVNGHNYYLDYLLPEKAYQTIIAQTCQ